MTTTRTTDSTWEDRMRKRRSYDAKLCVLGLELHSEGVTNRFSIRIHGSRGHIYTIHSSKSELGCSCPDFERRQRPCKHLYHVARHCSTDVYQQENQHQLDPEGFYEACSAWIERHRLQSKPSTKSTTHSFQVQRKDYDGEACAICLEPMVAADQSLVWCTKTCGNSVHEDCFERYRITQGHSKCVFCRSVMLPSWSRVPRSATTSIGSHEQTTNEEKKTT